MRKNRVKISQSKPKKSGPEVRTDIKAMTLPKERLNNSDSLSCLEIPSEPSFKLPIRSHAIGDLDPKSNSSDIIPDPSSAKQGHLFSNSHSDFEITPRDTLGECSDIEVSQPKDLVKQIKDLQNEISEMNQRIIYTEEEMKSKEIEAMELKELLIKLRENQVMIIETSEKQSSCKSCGVF
jgi:hypothetical protein